MENNSIIEENNSIIEENNKKIEINGTHNKYQMKKLLNNYGLTKEVKKRIEAKKWTFSDEYFEYKKQLNMIFDISKNNLIANNDPITKIVIQQINKKISSYKQQDIIKKHFDKENFITFKSIIYKMIDCELKCKYCTKEMSVLYDISREMCQWSVDRIDNNKGHNIDNYHLACLECNLKKRRMNDEKFLFTKQLTIIRDEY
jgi:hypothetical protein